MIINPTVERMTNGGWSFSWEETTPPYQVWLDGRLLATVDDEAYEFNRPRYENIPPDLEIVDSVSNSENETYPPYFILQWRGVLAAVGYVVEKFIDTGTGWQSQATIAETKQGYYSWKTPALPDEEVPSYRVKALDLFGNSGDVLPFTFDVVRNPEHPDVVIDFSAGDIVVSEA